MRNVYLALKRSVVFVLLLGCVAAFAGPVVNSFYPKADAAEIPEARIDTTNIPDSTCPAIVNFWPTSGQKGTAVFIFGSNFTGATAVRFGGVLADSVVIMSDTVIKAIVDTGATGSVSVTKPNCSASKPGFTFIRDTTNIPDSTCPVIRNFSPTSGKKGTAVFIFGSKFTGATAVRFGGVLADSVVIMSDTVIKAIVGTGATGSVLVTTPKCIVEKPGFTFIRDTTNIPDSTCPVIRNFSPTSGKKGTAVFIFGSKFTGASAVRFGGVLADSVVIMSDTVIKAIVGTGATGSVLVATPKCVVEKPGFTFIRDTTNIPDSTCPVIKNFSPTSGKKGTVVFIFGSKFSGATAVRFGGVLADSVVIMSDTVIKAIVGTGATGSVLVATPKCIVEKPGFTFIRDTTNIPDSTCPVIRNFSPTSGKKGTAVFIFGSKFTGATAVRFGGVLADSVVIMSDTVIKAIVGTGATGSVLVTTPKCIVEKPGFTFIRDTTNPDTTIYAIYNFFPKSAQRGGLVTILGSGFTNVYSVRFGSVKADSIVILSDTVIKAFVGNGETGAVYVTSPKGIRYKSGFTFIPDTTTPIVRSFYPTIGKKGTVVQILGKNLRSTKAVRFGGVSADSVRVTSDSTVRAIVGNGATGSVSVTTSYGVASKPGFTYIADTTINDTLFVSVHTNPSNGTTPRSFVLYPNPASKYVIWQQPVTGHRTQLQLVDMSGRIARQIVVAPNAVQTTIPLSGLQAGIYKLVYIDGKNKLTRTLLVK